MTNLPTATVAYWTAVKAVHAARLDPHPGKRVEAMAALRAAAEYRTGHPRPGAVTACQRLTERHGGYHPRDRFRITLWPDMRTVNAYLNHAAAGNPPDFHILDQEG